MNIYLARKNIISKKFHWIISMRLNCRSFTTQNSMY